MICDTTGPDLSKAHERLREALAFKGYDEPHIHLAFGFIGYRFYVCIQPLGLYGVHSQYGTPELRESGDELRPLLERAFAWIRDDLPGRVNWTPDLVGRTLGLGPDGRPLTVAAE